MSVTSAGGRVMSIAASLEEKGWFESLVDIFGSSMGYAPSVRRNNNVFKIQTGVGRVCDYFNRAGFPVGRKAAVVRVPKVVMKSSDQAVRSAFLRGFFDADGSIYFGKDNREKYSEFKRTYHYYPKISLASISMDLIFTDIRELFGQDF